MFGDFDVYDNECTACSASDAQFEAWIDRRITKWRKLYYRLRKR
jgi:hypothetical protein